jgi:hypothetical protein
MCLALSRAIATRRPANEATAINYDPSLLGGFGAGTQFVIGGTVGGIHTTGNIHVGADGLINLGDKSIAFGTLGTVTYYPDPSVVTTTGMVTILQLIAASTNSDADKKLREDLLSSIASAVANLGAGVSTRDQKAGAGFGAVPPEPFSEQ